MAHLVVRENSPLSVGIVGAPLASITDKETERQAKKPFDKLVGKVRKARNPMSLPGVDASFQGACGGDRDSFAEWMGAVEAPIRRSLARFAVE